MSRWAKLSEAQKIKAAAHDKAYYANMPEAQRRKKRDGQRKYYQANKAKIRQYGKEYYRRNAAKMCAQARAYRAAHPERKAAWAEAQRARQYGLTVQALRGLLKRGCGICRSVAKLHIDHCHRKGHVRAALCNNCNCGLGFFKENLKLLKKAVAYMEKHK